MSNNDGIRVLIIEDDDIAQIAAKEALGALGCVVDVAVCGREAVRFFKKHSYHLVFLDIAMVDMDGFTIAETFRDIEKAEKRQNHVPILAISAYDEDSFKKRAMTVGINHYLLKPMTIGKYKEILYKFFPSYIQCEQP